MQKKNTRNTMRFMCASSSSLSHRRHLITAPMLINTKIGTTAEIATIKLFNINSSNAITFVKGEST